MAVTHKDMATRTAIADLVVDRLDLSSPPAKLVFLTAANATVATLTFGNPAFLSAASGNASANPITSDTNAAGGAGQPITKAELRQGGGTAILECSVTATGGGGDITLNSVIITAGQQVSITALSYTAPA